MPAKGQGGSGLVLGRFATPATSGFGRTFMSGKGGNPGSKKKKKGKGKSKMRY